MQHSYIHITILFLVFYACGNAKKENTESIARPVKYEKLQALGAINKLYTGVVEPEEFSVLAFKIAGPLVSLNVIEGQKIRKGEIVARIDPFDYKLKYETAAANYSAAKSIYERNMRLIESHATSQENLEIAKAEFIQAGSALDFARTNLENTQLVAPFSGIVETKYVENYEELQVGEPVIKLVNPNNLIIRFTLPETNIVLIDIPKTIFVEFDTDRGHWFKADIKEYVYASTGTGIPVTVRINDDDFKQLEGDVYPGFSCRVEFRIENMIAGSFHIPESALMEENGTNYVWIINPKTLSVHRKAVEIQRIAGRIFVEKGLTSSDMIVTAGIHDLHENQKVRL